MANTIDLKKLRALLITKIDTKTVFDFDEEAVVQAVHRRNPRAEVLFVSAKTGEGMDAWCDWLRKKVKTNKRLD